MIQTVIQRVRYMRRVTCAVAGQSTLDQRSHVCTVLYIIEKDFVYLLCFLKPSGVGITCTTPGDLNNLLIGTLSAGYPLLFLPQAKA